MKRVGFNDNVKRILEAEEEIIKTRDNWQNMCWSSRELIFQILTVEVSRNDEVIVFEEAPPLQMLDGNKRAPAKFLT